MILRLSVAAQKVLFMVSPTHLLHSHCHFVFFLQLPTLMNPSDSPARASDSGAFFRKMGYKLWVLAAILLLAIWSMFTGSVTLKWSSITRFSDGPKLAVHGEVDILEVEEREKLVRKMWDAYSHSATGRLPRFWTEAFQAAYQQLVSEVWGVRDGAVSEIAKMSLLSIPVESQSGNQEKPTSKLRKALT